MIYIEVILHSVLRELLPAAAKGRMALELPEGERIRDVMERLSIPSGVVCAVGEQIETDRDRILVDGDVVRFLRPGAGG